MKRESACPGGSLQAQRPAGGECIAKLPWGVPDVLLCGDVLREVPALCVAGKDQFQLYLALPLRASLPIAPRQVVVAVMSHHFQQTLVSTVDVLKLEVECRVDPVFAHQWPHPVFYAEP